MGTYHFIHLQTCGLFVDVSTMFVVKFRTFEFRKILPENPSKLQTNTFSLFSVISGIMTGINPIRMR